MNFRSKHDDAPEINLIPFIDVLLVVIIFLMLSTTYARFTELQVNLPEASASPTQERPAQIIVAVSAEGRYAVDGQSIDGRSIEMLTARLLASAKQSPSPTVIVSADAAAAHQSVINVLDAARRAGLLKITFAAQTPGQGSLAAR
jgi:biopolymer transport protein ExbD